MSPILFSKAKGTDPYLARYHTLKIRIKVYRLGKSFRVLGSRFHAIMDLTLFTFSSDEKDI